ncbi:MAG: GTPase Era [Ignavibacteriae bacterium]|nr:MAG: GTPase Era [Ignavibacteriota bacterium]
MKMNKKAGFTAIIGKPNAGKSTLVNSMLGQSLSIVTPKPQTTRNKIFGIYTKDDVQIVFADTPGILDPKYKLQVYMKKEIESSFIEADVVILVVDGASYSRDYLQEVFDTYKTQLENHKLFCVINKIDLITNEVVLHIISDISTNFKFDEIIPLSAYKNFNVAELVELIKKYLPEHEFYYDEEIIASQPERFFVAELIRETVLMMYSEEIPFSVFVDIDDYKERERGKDFIRASLIVEKDSQKKIIIGSKGSKIKRLGEHARKKIEDFLGKSVFLELFVKVRKNWKNDEDFLKHKFKSGTSTL